MEPTTTKIQELALYDSVAAYGIALGIPRVPISMNCRATFSSADTMQKAVKGALDTTIAQRTWISNLTYSLGQPNVFKGNVFKTLYDAMLKAHSGIEVQIAVHSGPRYLEAPQFTPLENVVNLLFSGWPGGWPLFKNQSIEVLFQLSEAFPTESPNTPPYNVVLTFNGWQFLDHTLDDMSGDDAAMRLRKMGLCVPDQACLRTTGA